MAHKEDRLFDLERWRRECGDRDFSSELDKLDNALPSLLTSATREQITRWHAYYTRLRAMLIEIWPELQRDLRESLPLSEAADFYALPRRQEFALCEIVLPLLEFELRSRAGFEVPADRTPKPPEAPAVSRNIQRFRKECGWSLSDLAAKTGIDKKSIISHVSHGVRPHPKTLKEYAQAFAKELKRPITPDDLEK